ncbi:MAG: cytochrome c oxidase accessory protein CcoG [Rubrivivax sp.]|nr:MAG: cytochrome c oxidase accessory protein CcoG [Rubrivivax sp.]
MKRKVIPIRAVPAGAGPGDTARVISLYEKQPKIHPRAVHGWFAAWRWSLVWFTQALFYGLAWLPWHGRQALLFDLDARRFFIFDLVLYPQDFIYLTGLLVVCAFALFLFTAVAGRLWCGYACPQTVYTEIFLWVERVFEGDRHQRLKLEAASWDLNKLWRKSGKQLTWLAISLWTGFTFVGYFTPIRSLAIEATHLTLGSWEWFWVLFYGLATYGNAGYLREQVCKYMCPYARFQSAMFDHDTLVISYDQARGDPRGTRARSAKPADLGLGDCIDCGLCVQVCPTGIDIREGLQYECIGCAACIDVCNGVMAKMHYQPGLIRYATQRGMALHLDARGMLRHVLRPRVLVYSAVLLAITTALAVGLATRSPFKVDVVRDRGSLARLVGEGDVENVYRLQLMNATEGVQHLRIQVDGLKGAVVKTRPPVEVASTEARWVPVVVKLPRESAQGLKPGVHPLHFRVEALGVDGQTVQASVSEASTFVIPR